MTRSGSRSRKVAKRTFLIPFSGFFLLGRLPPSWQTTVRKHLPGLCGSEHVPSSPVCPRGRGLSARPRVPARVPGALSIPSTELRRPELVGMCVCGN